MQPILVDFEMKTALLGEARPTADAIIVAEHALRYGDAAALSALREHVQMTEEIAHASCILRGGEYGRGRTICMSGLLREWISTDPSTMAGGKTMRRGTTGVPTITVNGVRFKAENAYNEYNVYPTHSICALVVGELDYLTTIFADLWAIGKRRHSGWGRIVSVRLDPIDADPQTWGLLDAAGHPLRPLPLPLYRRLTGRDPAIVQNARCQPFYWSDQTPQRLCAMPHSDLFDDFVL